MTKAELTVIPLIILLSLTLVVLPVCAEEKEEDDLEWRLELIEASRQMMEEENGKDIYFNRIGTVFTNFGEANINTGLRLAPFINGWEMGSLHVMGELFYLRQEDDFAGFLSLFALKNNIYVGGGGELTGRANYHLFAGWEVTNNIFLELRAINTEGGFRSSKLYPVTGFQLKF